MRKREWNDGMYGVVIRRKGKIGGRNDKIIQMDGEMELRNVGKKSLFLEKGCKITIKN